MLLVVFVFVVFARTLSYGYYLDDHEFARPWTWHQVLGAFAGPFDPLGVQPVYFRPFVGVSFAIDWNIWGYSKWGFHLTNVALHAGATLAVYGVLRRMRVRWWAAVAGAAFFATVPSNAATAVYVAERSDAMAMIFIAGGLLCVHAYHLSRRRRWLVGLNFAFVLALLSKEIGIALLLMAPMYWWYLDVEERPIALEGTAVRHWLGEARVWWHSLITPERRRDWFLVVGPLAFLILGYLIYRWAVLPAGSLTNRFGEAASPAQGLAEGVANTFRGVPWEVRSLAWPALLAAAALAMVFEPRSIAWRTVMLGLGFVLAGCAPLAYSGGAEPRLLYVAQFGVATCVAGLATIAADSASTGKRSRAATGRTVAVAVVALTFVVTTAVTTIRAQDQFAPGSDKKLAAEMAIWSDEKDRALLDSRYLEEIRQHLIEAGMISP